MEPKNKLSSRKSKRFYLGLLGALVILTITGAVIAQTVNTETTDETDKGTVIVELTTDKTTYTQDETIQFYITVENPQDWAVPKPFQIDLTVKANNGDYYLTSSQHFTFAANSTATFGAHSRDLLQTYPWKVEENMERGSYTAFVTLSGTVNYGNKATCTLAIT